VADGLRQVMATLRRKAERFRRVRRYLAGAAAAAGVALGVGSTLKADPNPQNAAAAAPADPFQAELERCDQAIKAEPKRAELYAQRAAARLRHDPDDRTQVARAAEDYQKAGELEPTNAAYSAAAGYYFAKLNVVRNAAPCYHLAQIQDPSNAAYLNNLGYCYLGQNNLQAADTFLRQALAHNPGLPEARRNLLRTCIQQYVDGQNKLGAISPRLPSAERQRLQQQITLHLTQLREQVVSEVHAAEAQLKPSGAQDGQLLLNAAILYGIAALGHPERDQHFWELLGRAGREGFFVTAEDNERLLAHFKGDPHWAQFPQPPVLSTGVPAPRLALHPLPAVR
jgi:tetratricopeptide (TPR) repeat protein